MAPPAVLVGQASLHMKSDLRKGVSRTISLPLSPQFLRVDSLQVTAVLEAQSTASAVMLMVVVAVFVHCG